MFIRYKQLKENWLIMAPDSMYEKYILSLHSVRQTMHYF